MDAAMDEGSASPSPLTKPKTRSLSDSNSTPSKLSPSPFIIEATHRASRDDSSIPPASNAQPVTPRRPQATASSAFALHMPLSHHATPPAPPAFTGLGSAKPVPLSPKLDQGHTFASPTNILPRRSRGLDFSRAATSLHHSTLAEQSSPDSSPTMGGKSMAIPGRRDNFSRGPEQTSTSLWSMMGNQEKTNLSHSLGSTRAMCSDLSSSSDDDDIMDEDTDEAYVTTPQVSRTAEPTGNFGSPAMGSLMSFQQRQRGRKPIKKKGRGTAGLGFSHQGGGSSPPHASAARRESISWQAKQLHISGMDADEHGKPIDADGSGDGQRSVVRRPVTRRGNLLPKTKTFARIRAALFEENAPAETETRREAEVVKQVRESDVPDLEPRRPPIQQQPLPEVPPPGGHAPVSALSSPAQETLDDIPEGDLMGDLAAGLSSSFKQHAMRNSKGKHFWDTFSETSSVAGQKTPPPPNNGLPRGSSSGISEDVPMDSPSGGGPLHAQTPYPGQPPTATEITRRINSKRRRDDDFDPVSLKRRAVSPGLSVHNSPLPQSPMQRDVAPWGSRPGSNGGEKAGSQSAPSDSGSTPGAQQQNTTGTNSAGSRVNGKGRIGFQGMTDTHDGLMRMSIE
ncbi:uncharacterized protein F5Z01DRAFT_713894 [Emericellopsis atlantica]|uniref:Uncharacterized protein n=1 Tax=Emericellopsis atlantica TaxID=2614577 RepID=A0A9P7ZFD5_9HYPO|nr:uncharacterized protein F5Z01DRAFT_713894 [Emericellopsis atlantica]KAG9250458.1 hypothetical protein F5Z01DRAFT_713894 [Emericellopsis atlantica]